MKVIIFKDGKAFFYEGKNSFEIRKNLKKLSYYKFGESNESDRIKLLIENDKDDEILRLLVILSPIFITIFDNSNDLSFFKEYLKHSNFTYGLYPNFFEGFDRDKYFEFYKGHEKNEDIVLNFDNTIVFTINYIEDKYIVSLIALIEVLFNKYNRRVLIDYFKEIRNDIVINGRRSILANDIYAFYLSKYLINWALDLMKIVRYKDKKNFELIRPIYELSNNLKRPIIKKSNKNQ
ncbi:hypothetical protein HV819_02525 [Anaerococcus sp. AGMB00486]|uniref:Uncharacterized protein n=2 Tax=Anaerococcus TaxID=165779 RepID=A0ABX2N877_9FIRM|nr:MULTISPECIES: hypothetical protein [Anaerococcus]MDY3005421.1 hypothetical protein [Anaerococcus porci]MSS77328.1 hypothetical protein [Anaerococcus porci]NVF10870.1 hypothetical protein [Anaerococcus faecalis]